MPMHSFDIYYITILKICKQFFTFRNFFNSVLKIKFKHSAMFIDVENVENLVETHRQAAKF